MATSGNPNKSDKSNNKDINSSNNNNSNKSMEDDQPSRPSLREILGVDGVSSRSTTRRPKIVGHRGSLYEFLENTRPSFVRCVELHCDAVELDVYAIPNLRGSSRVCDNNDDNKDKDNNNDKVDLVVFHGNDGDPQAIPGSLRDQFVEIPPHKYSIMDLTYDECQALQCNSQYPEFAIAATNGPSTLGKKDSLGRCGFFTKDRVSSSSTTTTTTTTMMTAQIPLLRDVLLDLKDVTDFQIKIELKGPQTVQPVLELVESLDMVSQCCYSSFDLTQLQELRQLRPDRITYPTGALFDGIIVPENYLQLARDCGATEIHLRYDACTSQRIQEIHTAGFGSMAWLRGPVGMVQTQYSDAGNEDEACYQALIDTGVQQLCVNKPYVAVPLVQRLYPPQP